MLSRMESGNHYLTLVGTAGKMWLPSVIVSRVLTGSAWFEMPLCNLGVLCVSVLDFCSEFVNHRDTQRTQRLHREKFKLGLYLLTGNVESTAWQGI
jgi:hypothetical protein